MQKLLKHERKYTPFQNQRIQQDIKASRKGKRKRIVAKISSGVSAARCKRPIMVLSAGATSPPLPEAALPAAAADSGFRRRRGSNPGVMEEGTAAAASQPPSAGASADMTTDDVLATMGF